MRLVLQRVISAQVSIEGCIVSSIGRGYLLLVGIAVGDDESVVRRLCAEVAKVRLMADAEGKLGVHLKASGGEVLAVSQFTLLASFAKGNRPSFNDAARPEVARPLFELFVTELSTLLGQPVPTGVFGAAMHITLINDGPVTVVLE